MGTTSVRLPENLLEDLEDLAQAEQTDRSTVIRRTIERGLRDIAFDRAIDAYQQGGKTAWAAARQEGLPLLAFLEELRRRDLWFHTDEETLASQLEDLA